jgi:hypothetical protein
MWVFLIADDGIHGEPDVAAAELWLEAVDVNAGVYSAAYLADGTVMDIRVESNTTKRQLAIARRVFGAFRSTQGIVRIEVSEPERREVDSLVEALRSHLIYVRSRLIGLNIPDPMLLGLEELVDQCKVLQKRRRRFWRR